MRWPWQETIYEDGVAYLTRYTLLWTPWFRLYLHHIQRSDADRALHDHPWWFASLILRGGYMEFLPRGYKVRRPGSVIFHRAEDAHRIQLHLNTPDLNEIPAWTLVLCGRKARAWGFVTEQGWVDAQTYLCQKGL